MASSSRLRSLALLSAAALAAAALVVAHKARQAERRHPPRGVLVSVRGVRLHVIDTGGPGPALVLLHGSGTTVADMAISGLIAAGSRRHRVVAFDRPGFGHSDRPRLTVWTPAAQADLIRAALDVLRVERAVVVGHSWGAMVALALALDHPSRVAGLVLVSGYYFPRPRGAMAVFAIPTIPLVGDIISYTLFPLIGHATKGRRMFRKAFSPQDVPPRFLDEFSIGLALRPSQIRALAEESAIMVPAAAALADRYGELRLPVTIITGASDRIVNVERQSLALHEAVGHSRLRVLPGHGHMLHHFATSEVMEAIDAGWVGRFSP